MRPGAGTVAGSHPSGEDRERPAAVHLALGVPVPERPAGARAKQAVDRSPCCGGSPVVGGEGAYGSSSSVADAGGSSGAIGGRPSSDGSPSFSKNCGLVP